MPYARRVPTTAYRPRAATTYSRRKPAVTKRKYPHRRRYAVAAPAPAKPFRIAGNTRTQIGLGSSSSLLAATPQLQSTSSRVESARRAREDGSAVGIKTVHVPGNLGIADITTLKMSWNYIESGATFGTSYVLANTIIDPALAGVTSNFYYTQQYASFYDYYQCNASKISITVSNQDEQTKVLVIYPTLSAPGTGHVPLTLEAALKYPMAKHKYIGIQGSDNEISTLHHYVNFKKLMAEMVPVYSGGSGGFYFQGSTAGRMPSITFGGPGFGTQPQVKVYWIIQLWPTNNTDSGTSEQDMCITMENYVELFGTLGQNSALPTLNQDPEWLKDNPDYAPLPDPLDPGGTVPGPIIQRVVTKKYEKDYQRTYPVELPVDLVDSADVVKEDIMSDSVLVDRIVQAVKNSKK